MSEELSAKIYSCMLTYYGNMREPDSDLADEVAEVMKEAISAKDKEIERLRLGLKDMVESYDLFIGEFGDSFAGGVIKGFFLECKKAKEALKKESV